MGAPEVAGFLTSLAVNGSVAASNQILVRAGKGDKDRITMLPEAVKPDLAHHLERARGQHRRDLQHGAGWVELPMALARKSPNAGREWAWHGSSRPPPRTSIASPVIAG